MDKDDIKERIEILLKEANELRYINSRQTIKILIHVIDLCKEIDYVLGEKVANLYIAHCYNNIGENDKAIPLVLDSLHYSVKEELKDITWMSYNLLGIIFLHAGDMERSMGFFNNALAAAEEIDSGKKYHSEFTSKKSMVITYNNIAENYKLLRQYKEALTYSKKSYDIDTQSEYSLSKGISVLSLGEIYYLMEDYDNAESLSYKSLKYMIKYNHTLAEADAYKLMALTSWKKGIYEKADEYFHISMGLNEKESSPIYKIDSLISYFEYLKDQKRTDEALEVLTNACNLSIQYKLPEKVSQISLMLSSFYGDFGNYENAFKYAKLHYEYEELYTESYYNNIINSFNIIKKMQEIEKENNRIVEKNENLQIQRQSLQMLVDKISIISELGQKITSTLNMDSLMEMLYFSIRSFMNLSYFAVGLYDKNNCRINYFYIMDRQQKAEARTISIKDGQTFAGECIRSRKLIVINDISKEFDKYIDQTTHDNLVKLGNNSELNSLIYCPLIMNTEVIGIITIQSEEKDAFTEYHVEMVKSLSSYAAIAINNAIKSRELENLNQVLLSLSEIDQLTGIANRRKFDDYIDDIWNDSMENGDSIALLIIDTDYFKEYNDNYGHLEGDKCLSSIARSLVDINTRPHFVARYGGDEFIIVLPKCSIDDAIKFGEIIKTKMAELNIPHEFSKVSDRVTLSIGIACVLPDKDTTIKQLIREADDGLYIAKKRGKNQAAAIRSEGKQ